MSVGSEWGPLGQLAGVWEGSKGMDVAFSNEAGDVADTPYRERIEFKPFGPVENGKQILYGLDYRMAAWRGEEENPFHTEVGYWLWDATERQVMRCFIIPRGSVILAGGTADAEATSFTMTAEAGSEIYGILSNTFLARAARCTRYEVHIEVPEDGVMIYNETSTIEHARTDEILQHTDTNTLKRVAEA